MGSHGRLSWQGEEPGELVDVPGHPPNASSVHPDVPEGKKGKQETSRDERGAVDRAPTRGGSVRKVGMAGQEEYRNVV